ncbi:MAG: recombination mediator RecR [Deferribacteraceae bacterium]|nr:recombination mediator RecR [Deferribacteraceae bacterium]
MYKIRALDECVFELGRLPGVGRKTAARLAMHILKMKPEDVQRLADKIVAFKENTLFCSVCGGLSESEVCPVCSDKNRVQETLCVVEDAKDLFVIEQTGYYKGRYHVLGGKISPLDGIGPDKLRIEELFKRITDEGINEVILATNPDVDGETTAIYLTRLLKRFEQLKVTKLASGLPLGTHIEYADEMTVLRALEGRREL